MSHDNLILFEYPLNEKMRSWLRVESLLRQVFCRSATEHGDEPLPLFRAFSELLDIFERGEIRPELLRELERQQQKLQQWLAYPGVDSELISQLTAELSHATTALNSASRSGQVLRDDRLISQIRQRLNIPGGCCNFDLPTLHLWLHLPAARRAQDVEQWRNSLLPLQQSLRIILQLVRDSGRFQPQVAQNGFYQDNAEQAELLRLQLPSALEVYPQISGHKSRFAIRFLPRDPDSQALPTPLNFELACC